MPPDVSAPAGNDRQDRALARALRVQHPDRDHLPARERHAPRTHGLRGPEETAHLLRVPASARQLIESLHQAGAGQREEHDLIR
jgi:hypothetical protein